MFHQLAGHYRARSQRAGRIVNHPAGPTALYRETLCARRSEVRPIRVFRIHVAAARSAPSSEFCI